MSAPRAAPASGSQTTNAVAGTIVSSAQAASVNSVAASAVRNLATNSIGATGKGAVLDRYGGQHQPGDDDSAVERHPIRTRPDVAGRQPSGRFWSPTRSRSISPPGVSLGTAVTTIEETMNRIGVPATIHGSFQGAAKIFQELLSSEPFLVLAAFATIYISLGMLYESFVHPLTILSTLPSAGVGAVLALMLFHTQFDIIGMIGVILLIGIVKKNAIMMIDFALDAERSARSVAGRRDLSRPACCASGRS